MADHKCSTGNPIRGYSSMLPKAIKFDRKISVNLNTYFFTLVIHLRHKFIYAERLQFISKTQKIKI